MSCALRAIGTDFHPDAFLGASALRPDVVYHKGEPLLPEGGGRTRSASGFSVPVSPAGLDDLAGQIQDAILFLDAHEDEMRRLAGFPGVDQVFIDFGIRGGDVAARSDVFPAELLWKAGALDLDLVVTHYPATQADPCPS